MLQELYFIILDFNKQVMEGIILAMESTAVHEKV